MYTNGFGVTVPEGIETGDGYVKMRHGVQYTVVLINNYRGGFGGIPADADVSIDGKHIGTFRVGAGSRITLERSPIDSGRFTAFRADSYEGRQIGANPRSENAGLVKVVFRPGRVKDRVVPAVVRPNPWSDPFPPLYRGAGGVEKCCSMGMDLGPCSAAGTGLTGHSNQRFTDVEELDHLGYEPVTIYLRLVVEDGDAPRVLKTTPSRESPYPRPLRY